MAVPRLQRYQVLGRLATGGMAEVWLARSVGFAGFEKLVVLKTILKNLADNPQFVQMFINEARVAAMPNHPNCVQIFDLGKEDDCLYIAMEYLEGFSLSRVMKRAKAAGQKLPMPVLARIACDALSGLDHAHHLADREGRPLGLIHRDVSPDNLLISFAGQTKVVDFGIAKAQLSTLQSTRAGTVKGKFGYIAPEYLRGQPIDARADLFALGVVLYRALTQARPFTGPTEAAVTLAVLREEPKWPKEHDPALPEAMSAVVMMALAKQPDERFASAKVMRQAIEAAVRPADADEVGAYLASLWPPQDPERLALESLANGRSEESSQPALDAVVSGTFELPPGSLTTPGPRPLAVATDAGVPVLPPEPDSVSGLLPAAGPNELKQTVVLKSPARATAGSSEPAPRPTPRRSPLRWAAWLASAASVAVGAAGAGWLLRRPAPLPAPAVLPVVAPPAPVPRRPAAPTTGLVSVAVEAPVAVWAADRELGKAPGPFELPLGPARLQLKGPGIDQIFEVEVRANETVTVSELRRGTLVVKVEPWAYVKLDGKSAGQTPVRRELYEGPHLVELSNTELNVTRRVTAQVKAGETRVVSLTLE